MVFSFFNLSNVSLSKLLHLLSLIDDWGLVWSLMANHQTGLLRKGETMCVFAVLRLFYLIFATNLKCGLSLQR